MNAVFKALSDPTRRHVLELLRERPMTAGELADHFPVSKATMSAHFAVLREADLVDVRKAGKAVIYSLKLSVLEEALLGFVGAFSAVRDAAARPAELAVAPSLNKGSAR